MIVGDTLYFANSGGLVQGWDIAGLAGGVEPTLVFRFWAGDDIDATLVPDDEGMLYVGVEYERETGRSQELGQILKLDPGRPDDPLVWAVTDRPFVGSGVWATPAVHRDLVIVPTASGRVHGIDRASGAIRWSLDLPGPVWSSPTIVDDVLVIGFDNISAVQRLLEEGKILCTVDQHGDKLARYGIEYALEMLATQTAPADKETPVDLITGAPLP